MHWIDLVITVVPIIVVLGASRYARRFARGVVDFLAAGRVAGRYVISVGDLTAGLSVITLVSGSEKNYQTGYGVAFWSNIIAPVSIVLALFGYCTYRWRETRCLSKGQFIELRYGSKTFRIVTAIISTLSEMLTNAMGPAIAANFFIYYLGLPHKIMFFGIGLPCYVIIVAMCLTLALLIIWPAGRISLLITDCLQGLCSYPIFVMIVGFIILKYSWKVDILPVLCDRVPEQSFLNPYDVSKLRDFNLFALLVSVTSTLMNRASWIGNDSSNSGRSPHEQKMASVLGSWRNGFAQVMILLIALLVMTFMNSGNFSKANRFKVTNNEVRKKLAVRVLQEVVPDDAKRAATAERIMKMPDVTHRIGIDPPLSQQENLDTPYFEAVRASLGDSPEARYQYQKFKTLFQQMMMPAVLSRILPVGLFGIFSLLMLMLLVSTDDTRIFNATGCLVQDVILPCIKKGGISTKTHLLLFRLTALGIAIFFFMVALFFQQLDYIMMFHTIMAALWLGGAGPIMIGGLYTRFGNLTGAWCSIIFGSGTSLLGLICQRRWALSIYPMIEKWGYVESVDHFLRKISSPFYPWIHWKMNPVKCPFNSYEIFFAAMILAISSYVIGSLLTYKPFNLDKLLHRGIYCDDEKKLKQMQTSTKRRLYDKLIGITPEYTKGDRIIAWSVFFYTFGYKLFLTFIVVVVLKPFFAWTLDWWGNYFYWVSIVVPGLVGVISTVWFSIGGFRDLRQLFRDLAKRMDNPEDNGQVL